MKRVLPIILFLILIALLVPQKVPATILIWQAVGQGLMDSNFAYLEDGYWVQLIYAGADGQIDPPGVGGYATGDDVILDSALIGDGTGEPGEFTDGIDLGGIDDGYYVYVRFYDSPPADGSGLYYGNSALLEVPKDEFVYVWDMSPTGSYLWTAYTWIVPEPETYLTFLPALGFGVFIFARRRKRNKALNPGGRE